MSNIVPLAEIDLDKKHYIKNNWKKMFGKIKAYNSINIGG